MRDTTSGWPIDGYLSMPFMPEVAEPLGREPRAKIKVPRFETYLGIFEELFRARETISEDYMIHPGVFSEIYLKTNDAINRIVYIMTDRVLYAQDVTAIEWLIGHARMPITAVAREHERIMGVIPHRLAWMIDEFNLIIQAIRPSPTRAYSVVDKNGPSWKIPIAELKKYRTIASR